MFRSLSFWASFVLWHGAFKEQPESTCWFCFTAIVKIIWNMLHLLRIILRQAESYVLLFLNVGLDAEISPPKWLAQLIHVWLSRCTYQGYYFGGTFFTLIKVTPLVDAWQELLLELLSAPHQLIFHQKLSAGWQRSSRVGRLQILLCGVILITTR